MNLFLFVVFHKNKYKEGETERLVKNPQIATLETSNENDDPAFAILATLLLIQNCRTHVY